MSGLKKIIEEVHKINSMNKREFINNELSNFLKENDNNIVDVVLTTDENNLIIVYKEGHKNINIYGKSNINILTSMYV